MLTAVFTIVTTIALALGVVSAGMNFQTIYDIEMDRHYVAVTEQQLAEQYAAVEEKLLEARSRNDMVAVAEYGTILNGITQVRARSNVVAIGRQVEQKKQAFIDEQWSVFQANVAIGVVSWGMGKIGYGKVSDTYMRSKNWPPGSNVAVWNPMAGQSERIILGSKPELIMAEFSDELADFMNAILNGFDVARTVTAPEGDIQSALEASTFVSAEIDEIKNARPLPKDIGEYLAASMVKQVKRANPQIATEPIGVQAVFIRQQACQNLKKMWQDEQRDLLRAEALRESMQKLECDQLNKAAQPEQAQEKEEPSNPAEPGKEPEQPAGPAAVQAWIREDQAVLNREGNVLDNSFYDQKTIYQVSESSFNWLDTYVVAGEERHNLDITVKFDSPPRELVPGQEVVLTATFSGGGTLSTTWPFSAEFAYKANANTFGDQEPNIQTPWDRDNWFVDPSSGYSYTPWDPSFTGPATSQWVLIAPDFADGLDVFEVWVYWRACLPCNVTWTYRRP